MKKHLILLAVCVSAVSCTLVEGDALNPQFLNPVHNRLFRNEYQVNDFQFLFDASNQTVSIRSRRSSETVDNIYSLTLVNNPVAKQGIYRMNGRKSYNGFFIGLQYEPSGTDRYSAKIVIQDSELKIRDALNTWNTNAYVTVDILSYPYFKMSAGGTWVRVSASGIYNSSVSDHFTFGYNELVDSKTENQTHTLKVANISGGITNTHLYNLSLVTNISSTAAVYYIVSTNAALGALHSRYIGFDIGSATDGIPRAKIIASADLINPDPANQDRFVALFQASTTLDYTTLASVERPDALLAPLRTKGPWVFVSGNVYDQQNTTNWDFSIQDQSVSITVYSSAAGSSASISTSYALKTTDISRVFQLISLNGAGAFHNRYFTFKFRTLPGDTTERASFYLESTAEAAANRLSGALFLDNYVNIYLAASLGAPVAYSLQLFSDPALLPTYDTYQNQLGIGDKLYGATAFTREEAGKEFIYVIGGANDMGALSTTEGMYEIVQPPKNLRNALSRTSVLGRSDMGVSGWEEITGFGISGGSSVVAPFGGQCAWIGSRLFIYNPAKYTSLSSASFENVSPNYRLISTTTFTGAWGTAALPSSLTNRPHASFFASQGVLTLVAGLAFDEATSAYTMTNDIWQSYNSGASWAQMSKAAAFSPRYMATSLNVGSDIFLLGGYTADTSAGSFTDEIWKSSDNGLTWTKLSGVIPAAVASTYSTRSYGRMPGFVINNTMYIMAANTAYGGAGHTTAVSVYSSRNGGLTWIEEQKIDGIVNIPAGSRSGGTFGSAYVWSVNNSSFKGVLFGIGGLDQIPPADISPYMHYRVLRP